MTTIRASLLEALCEWCVSGQGQTHTPSRIQVIVVWCPFPPGVGGTVIW